ncbi:MAG TPA: polysaccharide biosynthesis/export family protein [Caulobacterales bacterium]|jgi:polysaccharide export outer membrane protein|nr:polysaccharide biosynthesis/export family protein [Caulobacterales bacterium]
MIRRIIFAAFAVLTGASCFAPASAQAPIAPQPLSGQAAAPVSTNYQLGPGDKVRVMVYGEADLSGEFFVSQQGVIAYPLIGEVPAAGRTLSQFQQDVADKLKQGFIKDPKVSAEVLNYRPFYILGEVMRPGTYPYSADMTVMNAVATAGGFTYRANTRRVFIKRAGENDEKPLKLDAGMMVEPGDTVRIGERLF